MKPSSPKKIAQFIKRKSIELGFASCGVAKASFLEEEAPRLESWLKKDFQGEMSYMNNHFDLRLDVRKLVPGAKSVIVLTYNYYPKEELSGPYKVAKYAYGRDYHKVLKKKLKTLHKMISEEYGKIEGRGFVDSGPVMERVWAKKAGLGWIGKNSLLLTKKQGSFYFICELILDLEIEPDQPVSDYCGSCTACMDACPTDAITTPYIVDGSKCISYLTIELKNEIPSSFKNKMEDWVFGCDICQDVCPWNRFSKANQESDFTLKEGVTLLNKGEINQLLEVEFHKLFEGSPIKRTGFRGISRNVTFLKQKK